jgi:hypothetical protein
MDEMIDFKKYIPHAGLEVDIITVWGIRRAVYCIHFYGFEFIDCNHPMQNRLCAPHFVASWRYVDKANRDNIESLLFPNHYERQKEGEEILSTIKDEPMLKKIFDRFIAYLNRKLI